MFRVHGERMNKAGSKIAAHAVVTMETSSAFLRSPKGRFFKDGLVKYDVSAG